MILRWVGSAYLATEKNSRRMMGYRELWILKAILDDQEIIHAGREAA
jgi:hypothetical protein